MRCQIHFSRKNKKEKYFKMSSAEIFTQHAKCSWDYPFQKTAILTIVYHETELHYTFSE